MASWKHHGWMEGGLALMHGHLTRPGLSALVISLAASWTASLLSPCESCPVLNIHVMKHWFAGSFGPCHCPWGSLPLGWHHLSAGVGLAVDEWEPAAPWW